MYPNWNLEELEYWKIAANTHFSLRGFELLGAETSRLRLILLVDIMSGARRPSPSYCASLMMPATASSSSAAARQKCLKVKSAVNCGRLNVG